MSSSATSPHTAAPLAPPPADAMAPPQLPSPLQVTSVTLRRIVPDGRVQPSDFELQHSTLDPQALKEGEALAETLYLSVDPYMRSRLAGTKGSYVPPFEPGAPLDGGCVAIVRASHAAGLSEGTVVAGPLPFRSWNVLSAEQQERLQVVDPALLGRVPLSYFLGVLGMPGMTAYVGVTQIAQPKAGDVALVSAAAGAVGLVVGQLLKQRGCKVIGSAGSDDKVKLLKDVGFDSAFNYRTHSKVDALAEAAPKGIDIYWDNVGGAVLEHAIDIARPHARFVMCGAISQYDLKPEERYGVKNLFQVVAKRLKLQGFIVGDYQAELGAAFAAEMGQLVTAGKLVMREQLSEGIERAGAAFVDMMAGGNTGKAVVRVAPDPFPVRGKDA